MTRRDPKPPTERCATCGEPHEYDTQRGFYAADGHPYARQEYPPLKAIRTVPDTIDTVTFQAFWRCKTCRALLERDDPDVNIHADVCPGGGGSAA